jgi:tripartite ATP-independent transporter DctM subunit
MAKGNFAPQIVSVGNLFAGAFIPGQMLAIIYVLYVVWKAVRDPESCPALVVTEEERRSLLRDVMVSMVPTLALIVAVLGSILGGFATPTESAAVGAVGAMALAAARGRFTLANLRAVMDSTAVTTTMVFVILLGASVFGLVFRILGGDKLMEALMTALPGGQVGAIVFVMALMFVLGFILDTFEIIFVIVPITAPVLFMMDVDPVWLGVIIAVNLQTSFLTPPFGFALIYLRSVAPNEIRTAQIYRGAIPFVFLQIVMIALLILFPALATWLPKLIYGG